MAKKPLDWGTREGVNMSTIKKAQIVHVGVAFFIASLLAACTSTTVDEFRQGETGI